MDHRPVVPAFAYRFDASDRSIVISGDTALSQNLVKLAAGADVLVHSVMYPPAIDRLVARVPNAAALKASILADQTSAEDAGRWSHPAPCGALNAARTPLKPRTRRSPRRLAASNARCYDSLRMR